jgi:hypothetical protein
VAKHLQSKLQRLVDDKEKIDKKIYTLAFGCKSNLEKKMQTMPGRPVIEPAPVDSNQGSKTEPTEAPRKVEIGSAKDGEEGGAKWKAKEKDKEESKASSS